MPRKRTQPAGSPAMSKRAVKQLKESEWIGEDREEDGEEWAEGADAQEAGDVWKMF